MGKSCVRILRQYVSQLIQKYFNNYLDENSYKTLDILAPFNLINDLEQIICKFEDYTKIVFFIDEIKHLLTLSPK